MNPLIREASQAIGQGWLAGILTILFMVAFFAWVWYAYAPANRKKFEAAAKLPFEDGGDS